MSFLVNKIFTDAFEKILDFVMSAGNTIIKGVLAIIFGYLLCKFIYWVLKRILYRSIIDNTTVTFILSIVRGVLVLIYIFAVGDVFNIPITSMAAIVAASGVAIGLALKDSLSNISNGILIVTTKPFREGDYVQIGSLEGTITAIHMVNTVLTTFDNKKVIIPNNTVASSSVTNYTAKPLRRLDIVVGASYDADVDVVLETLRSIANNHPNVLKDPSANIRLSNHGASALEYKMMLWVNGANFWSTKFDILEEVVRVFNKKGIAIPYNQVDVHFPDKTSIGM